MRTQQRILGLIALWTTTCVLGSSRTLAEEGEEVLEVSLSAVGLTLVGSAGDRTVAGTLSLLGCSWIDLGPVPLSDSIVLRGTDADDTIRVIESPVVFCNRLLQPITQNGRAFILHGGRGNDSLSGGGSAPFSGNPNAVFGDEGDDRLLAGPGGVRVEGGPGDDVLFGGDSSGDILLGGAGDDVLCEHEATTALTLDGGAGNDVSCTANATEGAQSIEQVSCVACGPGF